MSEFKTTSIKFTSRSSVKIKDNYYTFEATIEKQCPETYTTEDYETAKYNLWDEVNREIDGQITELVEYLKNKR